MLAIQQDVANIYSHLGHLEDRVDRIEIRLGLVEPGQFAEHAADHAFLGRGEGHAL